MPLTLRQHMKNLPLLTRLKDIMLVIVSGENSFSLYCYKDMIDQFQKLIHRKKESAVFQMQERKSPPISRGQQGSIAYVLVARQYVSVALNTTDCHN